MLKKSLLLISALLAPILAIPPLLHAGAQIQPAAGTSSTSTLDASEIEGNLIASTFPLTNVTTMSVSFAAHQNLHIVIYASGSALTSVAEPTALGIKFNGDYISNLTQYRNYYNHSSLTRVSVSTAILLQEAVGGHSDVLIHIWISNNATDAATAKTGYFVGSSITGNAPATAPDETHGNFTYNSATAITSIQVFFFRSGNLSSGALIASGATGRSYIRVYGAN